MADHRLLKRSWLLVVTFLWMLAAPTDSRADLTPGLYLGLTLSHGGMTRVYDVRIPLGYNGNPIPLVVDLHSYSGTPTSQRNSSGFTTLADTATFAVVWPLGLGQPGDINIPLFTAGGPAWNAAGWCCGDPLTQNVDDVGFIRAVVAAVEAQVSIDHQRIYATGRSNGGALTHRLACEASDLIAAAATFAWPGPLVACAPARPIPVLMTHAVNDTVVPYAGGHVFLNPAAPTVPSAATEFEAWRVRDGCTGAAPDVTENPAALSECEFYTTCSAGVQVGLCSVQATDNGHTPYPPNLLDGFDTTLRAWQFLSAYYLPEPAAPLAFGAGAGLLAWLAHWRRRTGAALVEQDQEGLCAHS